MADPKRILMLSGYDAGSHRRWREQLTAALPDYHWQVMALPPRYFRWRIRGNPLSWLNEPALQQSWDLILATSMVDLATLKGLHPSLGRTPALLYMHENQFAYPDSGRQHASADPQMVNLYSALAADRVLFNSAWNRDSFLEGIRRFSARLPDQVPPGLVTSIQAKSRVVPVPIADHQFVDRSQALDTARPHLLWNHRWECESVGVTLKIVWASRWEYDKGPTLLLAFLDELEARKLDYRLCLLGERFRNSPKEFETIRQRFAHRLVQFGYAESRDDYSEWLRTADVVLSTALHEFQGLSVLEAVASGCVPLVPNRLSYPELFGQECCYESFPDDPGREAGAAVDRLEDIRGGLVDGRTLCPDVRRFSAATLWPEYAAEMGALLS